MKIIKWISENILFVVTLFLLAFIPLYPKIPLFDVKNTWVYVRGEDFAVLFALVFWVILLIKRKVTLRTPLTIPIMIFWIIGAIVTIHGIILIFPGTANVFPNVAFLTYLRHIEYISLFFIAYSGMRDKRFLGVVITILSITLLAVVGYGIGQKYFEFPAYLTMNEEFAKGVPIRLSELSRVPSTFGGHYDLAAYLVLIVPILVSLVFGLRKMVLKLGILIIVALGFVLLFMTVSRVSFFVLLISLFVVLFFQKKRFVIFSIPLIVVIAFAFLIFQPTLIQRFGSTVRETNVLVDAKTGEAIGHVNYVPAEYFKDKIIKQKYVQDKEQLDTTIVGKGKDLPASPSALFPFELLPPEVPLVVATNASTGENLPQGTGYINLSLSPVTKKLGNFFYEVATDPSSTTSAQILIFHGDFLIKRASAYDLSFTTRFQGEWPKAMAAFGKNVLFGSGYGSVGLAVDNNYLRVLAETGLLGTISFFAIFLAVGIYIRKLLPNVESGIARSFVIGFAAGVIGLALNATLIDVFEASKVAFLLWLLTGVTLGVLSLYKTKNIALVKELKNAAVSTYAIMIYLFIGTIVIFSPMISNYFVGDDFTWFRWAADSSGSLFGTIYRYFLDSDGFFYRPGTKLYFYLMYSVFWLNQVVFHIVSLLLHFIATALFFLIAKKILRSTLWTFLASLLFLIMSGYSENVFWISTTGRLFNNVFILLSLLMFIFWVEKRRLFYYVSSILFMILALLFHEMGVIIPLILIAYKSIYDNSTPFVKIIKKREYLFLFVPILAYLFVRFISNSHWFSGDYSYDILKFPLNAIGNIVGYLSLIFLGSASLPFYQALRNFWREHVVIALIISPIILFFLAFFCKIVMGKVKKEDLKIIKFGLLFFLIALLPFLGLGNITSRYSYLASFGLLLIFVLLIQKLYNYLINFGKDIAFMSIVIVIAVFSLFHIIQVQQIHGDWHTGGNMTKRFFVTIDSLYADHWSKEAQLHFVNVPIKHGEAWVFPVGLEDAVWLSFRNDKLRVYKHSTIKGAISVAGTSPLNQVLKFNDDGGVEEVIRPTTIP